jgi:hypothetical protein
MLRVASGKTITAKDSNGVSCPKGYFCGGKDFNSGIYAVIP